MIFLLLVFAILRARAAPLSAGPATDPTIAHAYIFGIQPRAEGSEASMRTLYDVAKSCFITVGACVYRSIHQNIPDPSLTFWGRLRVRAKITFYALIAPELMILWAMRQRFGAKEVVKYLGREIPSLKWTQTHGQFLQMGGFARQYNNHVLDDIEIATLTKSGRIELQELVRITKEDIQDKSKGDILSKSVVAFQTTWFVFECTARMWQGLPLLELEVVTLAFATLNIITYFLWWHKPLDVLRPIYLHVKPLPSDPIQVGATEPGPDSESEPLMEQPDEKPDGSALDTTEGPAVSKAGLATRAMAGMGKVVERVGKDIHKRPWYVTVWKRLLKEPFIAVTYPLIELANGDVYDIAESVPTFFAIEESEKSDIIKPMVWLLSSFIGMIFGAIHFISWNATFHTHTQLLLWRASSIALVVEPSLLFLGSLVLLAHIHTEVVKRTMSIWGDTLERVTYSDTMLVRYSSRFLVSIVGIGGFLSPILYILARMCLIVLAFLTLRDLPPHALDTISWTSYIPHI